MSNARTPSEARFSGRHLPAYHPRSSLSRSGPSFSRRLEPWGAHSRQFREDPNPIPTNPPRQIPIHNSNNDSLRRRQESERPIPTFIHQPVRPQPQPQPPRSSSRFTEEAVLKRLTKQTYNPARKSQLLRNLSLYYRGGQSFGDTSDDDEDGKRCTVCLEDFLPKETVRVTPCNHMFHEECIVPWVTSKGQCPVCRAVICESDGEAPPVIAGDMTADDFFDLELLSLVRALEESFIFGYPRRL